MKGSAQHFVAADYSLDRSPQDAEIQRTLDPHDTPRPEGSVFLLPPPQASLLWRKAKALHYFIHRFYGWRRKEALTVVG